MPHVRRTRLAVRPLEDRVVPAFNLAIDAEVDNSVNVTFDTASIPGTTVCFPNASGAVLDVDDIEIALNIGNVLITTGTGGIEPGNVTYTFNDPTDDLAYVGDLRTLTIRPDASSSIGNVTITGVPFGFFDSVDLVIDTTLSLPDGRIELAGVSLDGARSVTLNAGTGRIDLWGFVRATSADVTVAAGTFAPGGAPGATLISEQGNVTLNAPVTLAGNPLTLRAGGAVTLNDAVTGPGNLTVAGTTVAVNAPIGEALQLTTLTFATGTVTHGANDLRADTVRVGDSIADTREVTFGNGTGAVNGTLVVLSDGNLAPGGVGTVGALTVLGSVVFQGGDFAVDLGATSDHLQVVGDLTLTAGRLGNEQSTGALTGPGDVALIDFTGSLTGQFSNAPLGSGFYLADEVVRVTHYGPAATGVTVARVPSAAGGVASGFDSDGTQYTFKLTGDGELVTFKDATAPPNRQLNVFVRNPSVVSKVTLTTKANASDTLVDLGAVRIGGGLGAFVAPAANLFGPITADGPVLALTFGRVFAPITLGGQAVDKTRITAEFVGAPITTPGILSAVTVAGDLFASIGASAIGTIKVAGQVFGLGPDWNIPNGIKAITAGRIESLRVTSSFLGTLTVTGSRTLSGDVSSSLFRLTGDDGTPARFGLKTLTAKGNVRNTQFDVEEGNVGTVTVGRFIDSQLYVDYTPGVEFHTGGSFDTPGRFKVGKFTTTALPLGDPTNPLNFAFAGSQVAADTLGVVRLSGLETANGGSAFGFKFRTAGGSVRTKTADAADPNGQPTDPDLLFNTNLVPTTGPHVALAGDFYYMDV